jgi:hypothetical protein
MDPINLFLLAANMLILILAPRTDGSDVPPPCV